MAQLYGVVELPLSYHDRKFVFVYCISPNATGIVDTKSKNTPGCGNVTAYGVSAANCCEHDLGPSICHQ